MLDRPARSLRRAVALAAPLLVLGVTLLAPAAHAAATINLTDQTWVCKGPQHGTVVNVTITEDQNMDGVHLNHGCSGHLTVHVTTSGGDGVKVHDGAQDVTVTGSVVCTDIYPGRHQDGVQAMGGGPDVQFGDGVTTGSFIVDCPTGNNGGLWLDQGKGLTGAPPHDVICNHCDIYENNVAIHVRNATTSGARNSVLRMGTGGASPHAGCTRFEPPTIVLHAAQRAQDIANTCVEPPPPYGTGPMQIGPGWGTAPPSAPSRLSAAASPTRAQPTLSWSAVGGAASYVVSRDGVTVGTTSATNWSDAALGADGTYAYAVAARGGGGVTGAASAAVAVVYDTTPPDAPADLTASAPLGGPVTLTWSDPGGAVGYRVWRDGAALATVAAAPFDDTPSPGDHVYAVSAVDAAGNEGVPGAPLPVIVSASGPSLSAASAWSVRLAGGAGWKLKVSVAASSPVGVSSVALLVGGSVVATASHAPYLLTALYAAKALMPPQVTVAATDSLGAATELTIPVS